MRAGPDPAPRYRMRAPSTSIQHSSTPVPAAEAASVETPRDWFITTKSYSPEDNSFITARVYLSEHRLCSFHLGELRLPAFYLGNRLPAPPPAVILSAADGSRNAPSAKSKDPIPLAQSQARQGISIIALGMALNPYFGLVLGVSTIGSHIRRGRTPEPGSRRLPLLPQKFLQHPNHLIHMLLLQQKRRQKPHDSILCTVEQNSLRECRIHDRPSRNLQIDPLNKSSPPYSLRGSFLLYNRLQLLLQIRTNL